MGLFWLRWKIMMRSNNDSRSICIFNKTRHSYEANAITPFTNAVRFREILMYHRANRLLRKIGNLIKK